jgi:predicted DNA binding CopG/RHH family protein
VRTSTSALKPVPAFDSEAAERAFWESHDSTGYVDWPHARRVQLPRLKPTSKSISLRLPIGLLDALRTKANRRDVPYQSLIKVWLSEKVAKKTQV